VLQQEVELYNRFIETVKSQCEAVVAEVESSASTGALADVVASLQVSAVPHAWSALSFPTTKALPSWLSEVNARVQFLNEWVTHASAHRSAAKPGFRYWLPGMLHPSRFLLAVAQVSGCPPWLTIATS
jgi:dynein heavy chain